MRYLISATLLIVAVIHLLPLVGVLGAPRLTALYGISFDDANLAILMRHRAVLFGLLGAFLAFAAFRPTLQPLAFLAGFAVCCHSSIWLGQLAATTRRLVVSSSPTWLPLCVSRSVLRLMRSPRVIADVGTCFRGRVRVPAIPRCWSNRLHIGMAE